MNRMAREILFKAKSKRDGKWIEGSLLVNEQGTCMISAYLIGSGMIFLTVDSNTICQYTGLTDKNGNKIWENDVVKDKESNIYKCYWCSCNCEYMLDDGVESFGLGYRSEKDLEVIGNIFDNPELLGGADNG